MTKLFNHQKEIIDKNPLWCGFWLGTGGGKTRIALELAEGKTLIICPKQQVLDETWQNNAKRFDIPVNLTVISKETFRRDWQKLPYFDTVIADEVHTLLGVTADTRQVKGVTVPKTSQLFEAFLGFLQKNKPIRFYMASATPVSKPMNVWAIAKLLGNNWDFFAFRDKYYIQRKQGWRSIWIPKNTKELKDRLAQILKMMGHTGRLQDWFDVPEQFHITKYLSLTSEQKEAVTTVMQNEPDPMVQRTKRRTIENGCLYEMDIVENEGGERMVRVAKYFKNEKIDYILARAEEFPKMLIFANYTAQIEEIARELKRAGYDVLTLTGSTPNRKDTISEAELKERCIVVAQAGISSGYELKTVNCVIFASKSYRFLDYDQGVGRVLRADALKKNLYIHLVVKDGVDEDCHKTILSGKDFQEKIHE